MKQRGLTLIEVIIAMGITSIAGILLVVIIVNSAGLFSHQSSKVQEGLNINDALSEIRGSIKQASAVADHYTNGPTTYTTGVNQLVLKVASIDSSGNIISDTYDFFVFFIDNKILHFKTFPDPASFRKAQDRIFSTSSDSLVFKYFNSATPPVEVTPISASKVVAVLTLKQRNGLNYEINIATSEANLRNG